MTVSNLVQAAVTMVVAVLVAAAVLLATAAGGEWQQSLRDELKRSAAIVEDVRYVYNEEAPLALELAFAQVRESELQGGDSETEREAVFAVRQQLPPDHLAGGRYDLPGGGYDVGARLADVREEHPDLLRLDPDARLASGDRHRRVALALLVTAIGLVLLYLVAELVLRRRGSKVPDGDGREADVGLVPRPWSSPITRRLWVSVALVAWLAVTLLPALQIYYTSEEQRADSLGARKASEVSTMLVTNGLVSAFASNGQQKVVWMKVHGVGRQLAAADSLDVEEAAELRSTALTEQALSEKANTLALAMSRFSTPADGLDAVTVRAIHGTPRRADAFRMQQNAEVDAAELAGARANRVTLAILLAALAASLCALGASSRTQRHSSLDLAAAGVVAMSLAALASVPIL